MRVAPKFSRPHCYLLYLKLNSFLSLSPSLGTNHCDLLASAPPSNVMSSAANSTFVDRDSLNITEKATGRDSVGIEPPSKRSRHSPPSSSPVSLPRTLQSQNTDSSHA